MSREAVDDPSGQRSSRKARKLGKVRLDVLLVERGLAASRERAQALLLAGQIRVNGATSMKAGAQVRADARIDLVGAPLPYVSRGGLKLEGALEDFSVSAEGKICLDVGSSNGGFTDCLLQHGAHKVYAVDVNVDQLDRKLRLDKRIVSLERNARYLQAADIGEPVDPVVVDVSFISVSKILPAVVQLAAPGADLLILIKPQFELEKRDIGKGGIVREPELHRKAIEQVKQSAAQQGLKVIGVHASRITGAEGNQEFFLHAKRRE
jgi:23S rRNA (cytidine1920-2'-O)/16S rRNA (cytidine1409-2'-O)-methyltransferase